MVVMMKEVWPAIVVLLDNYRWWAGDIDRCGGHHGRRPSDYRGRGPRRRFLHRRDDITMYSLLRKRNKVARLQWPGNAIGADVVDDQLRRHARAGHLNHVVGRRRAYGGLHIHDSHLLSDLLAIPRFDIIEGIADERPAQRPGACANQRPGAGIADGIADDRTHTGAAQAAQ